MEEISTSFCFICLLHLANEQGLKLQGGLANGVDNDIGTEVLPESEGIDRVADIWSLKVCDPVGATPPLDREVDFYSLRSSETRMLHLLHDE